MDFAMDERFLVTCDPGELIVDCMIEDAAREVAIKTGADFTDCVDWISDYVNGMDWMLAEETEDGEPAIDINFFSRFLSRYSKQLIEELKGDN